MANEQVERWDGIQRDVERAHRGALQAAILDAMQDAAALYTSRQRAMLPPDHEERIRLALVGLYTDITERMGSDVIEQFKDGYVHLETKQDNEELYRRIWEAFVQQYGARRIVQISDTTREQVQETIRQGLRDGLSTDEIAKLIRQRANVFSALRSAVIAATETHSAAMYASTEVAKTSSIPLLKEWVSVADTRTRTTVDGDEFDHAVMHGQRVPMDQPFRVPSKFGEAYSEQIMFPGDPNGSAANIINCRCSQVYVRAN